LVWDQEFFYEMGLRCIERNGLGHVRILARNVLNMGATTVPWPQVNEAPQRDVVRLGNLAYSLLLPLVVIDSVFVLLRRPASGRSSGEAVMLLQLACALVVAILFFGDPRVRSTYDVFGLALLAARITDRLGLEESRRKPADSGVRRDSDPSWPRAFRRVSTRRPSASACQPVRHKPKCWNADQRARRKDLDPSASRQKPIEILAAVVYTPKGCPPRR
jgi:hypothetical protein